MILSERAYDEKRSFIRMKIDTMVTFTVDGGSERYNGRCKNISGAGMLLETEKKLALGTRLYLTVPSENSELNNLNAQVEVIRIISHPDQHKFEIGVVIKKIHS